MTTDAGPMSSSRPLLHGACIEHYRRVPDPRLGSEPAIGRRRCPPGGCPTTRYPWSPGGQPWSAPPVTAGLVESATRQRRYRERRNASEPVRTFRRPKDRRSRPATVGHLVRPEPPNCSRACATSTSMPSMSTCPPGGWPVGGAVTVRPRRRHRPGALLIPAASRPRSRATASDSLPRPRCRGRWRRGPPTWTRRAWPRAAGAAGSRRAPGAVRSPGAGLRVGR